MKKQTKFWGLKVKIEINNWEKYLHRKDMKSLSWFRVNSDIMHHPKFHKMPPEAGWFFICLLGFAAKKMSATVDLPDAYLLDITGCDPVKCANILNKVGLVRICTDLNGSVANITEHYNTKQNRVELRSTSTVPEKSGPVAKNSKPYKHPNDAVELWNLFPESTKERLQTLYGEIGKSDFLKRELTRIHGYYAEDNPRKCPKSVRGWCQASSSWLERSWNSQAKGLKGNDSGFRSAAQRREDKAKEMLEKIDKGEL